MAHQEYENLLTLRALDALDASAKRELDQHLETCPECRSELTELSDSAGLLAHAAAPAEPGPKVRARILNQVRNEKRSKNSSASLEMAPFKSRPAASPWPGLLRLAAAIAFVALLAGMIVLWQRDVRSRREIARLTQEFNQQKEELARNRDALAHQRAALELMNSPGMKRMELAGTQTAATARATFVYDRQTGRAMIMTDGLPATPSGMAYEVWFIPKGHSPMPGKTFTVDSAGQAMMMDQMPAEAREGTTIAVTLEPKSGSASPTGAIYLASPAS